MTPQAEKIVRAFLLFIAVIVAALLLWGCDEKREPVAANAGTAAADRSAELNNEQAKTLEKLGKHQDAAANAIDAASMTIAQLKEALGLE